MANIFSRTTKPVKGLLPVELLAACYLVLTLVLMIILRDDLVCGREMLLLRVRVAAVTLVMWALYRLYPCTALILARVLVQVLFLADWYPDTYEFNRCFVNLDHVVCGWEQWLFGCQPALLLSTWLPFKAVSELLDLGYAAYYPIIVFTLLFYFCYRRKMFQRAAFVIMGAFFVLYAVFIFFPVAGPTFYFRAVGTDVIEQGVFPAIGHYFSWHNDLAADCLPTPGWQHGLMWKAVEVAKWAGERPTAAFPSSHIGVTAVCMLLLWRTGNRRVFWTVLPLAVLMFFATVYIQAHYAVDALAGLIAGALLYFLLYVLYGVLFKK